LEELAPSREGLVCAKGGEVFRIENGIPRFVSSGDYAEAFGLQWKKYRRVQLDSYSGTSISAERVHRCLGEQLWTSLRGKQVLECGRGAGRFTEVLLRQGANVTSVDITAAVDSCAANCPIDDAHRIAQADVLALPFKALQFDVVFCLGVVQHTPNPEKTIAALYEQVKPGGMLVIDHYSRNLSYFTKTAPLFRSLLKRLPPEQGIRCTEALVNLFLRLHRKTRRFRLGQMLLSRISPVLCYYRAYPELSDELQREWALVDTHDSLTDWYAWFRSPEQIKHTFDHLGLEEIQVRSGGNGVEAIGKRPEPGRRSSSSPKPSTL
jgi:SAM-dependent methyltransferase